MAPGLRQAGSGHVQCLPLQVHQDDTRTALGELPGNRQADAARAAGDQGRAAVEVPLQAGGAHLRTFCKKASALAGTMAVQGTS